jgi:glycosyltransferase involved in cell wall biosynthesis
MIRLNTGILERLRSDLRSQRELGIVAKLDFHRARLSSGYRAAFREPDPLVSICTATYNRAELLIERSLASSRAQTYPNIEIIVVGDGCTDDTAERMRAIADPRIRFVNLEREAYPVDPDLRWMVAGAQAINHALGMARGTFVTQLDDDDTHAPDRVEKLVRFAQAERADLIYHPFAYETPEGEWLVNDAPRFQLAKVTSSSIFFHRWFLKYPYDRESILRHREPGDWNRMRKYRYLGARIRRHPEILLRHFRERSQATTRQVGRDPQPPTP